MAPVKLHLGCGTMTPEGWINTDGSLNSQLTSVPLVRKGLRRLRLIPHKSASARWNGSVRYLDVRRRLPFADRSVDYIYASHLLEHIYYSEAAALLVECRRILKGGGIIRVVVPDLQAMISAYSHGVASVDPSETPADLLNVRLAFHPKAPPENPLYRLFLGWRDFHSHKWMYDAESLANQFQRAGFPSPCVRAAFDSSIPEIHDIEKASRASEGEGLCMEAVAPAC